MFCEKVKIHPTLGFDCDKLLSLLVEFSGYVKRCIKGLKAFFKPGKNKSGDMPIRHGGLGIVTRLKRWLLIPDPQFLWIISALPKLLWISRRCDVIYSSAWPVSTHILGLVIHKITGKPWVADYRDEWTLNSQWFPPTRLHRRLGEDLDRQCVKNASYIVNVTEPRTENFRKKYPEYAEKCVTIHNGYDEADVANFRSRKPPDNHLRLVSLGSLYGGRDPWVFLNSLQKLVETDIPRDCIQVLMIGAGNPNLEIAVREQYHLDDIVEVLPRMPQSEAFEYLARSHVALLFGSEMERVAMTTKVYEYAGLGKKIFALVPDGPVKEFVQNCGGICAMYNDFDEIKRKLKRLIEEFKSGELKEPLLKNVSKYERKNLTGEQAAIFDSCLNRKIRK
jgi:glycosyltransferase involved in cell wall biosynthesis